MRAAVAAAAVASKARRRRQQIADDDDDDDGGGGGGNREKDLGRAPPPPPPSSHRKRKRGENMADNLWPPLSSVAVRCCLSFCGRASMNGRGRREKRSLLLPWLDKKKYIDGFT